MPGMHFSLLWADVFTLQAVLLVVAGVVRSDLVIRPRMDVASGLGAAFTAYALIAYPLIGYADGLQTITPAADPLYMSWANATGLNDEGPCIPRTSLTGLTDHLIGHVTGPATPLT